MLASWEESYRQHRQHIKKQRYDFANKGPSYESYGFSSSYVWMWELDFKESWALKNWHFWTMMLEKTLESALDFKDIQPVYPKGYDIHWKDWDWSWTPVFWPTDAKTWLIGKDLDSGKDWRWEEKGTTENEMAGCHHWLNGHEFE